MTIRSAVYWAGAVAIVALAVAPLVQYWLTNQPDQRLVDLDVYRTGGQSVLLGRSVYDTLTPPPQLLPFTYPPLGAVFAVPLAMLPWPAAQWVWTALLYIALALTVAYAFRPLLSRVRTLSRYGWAVPLAAGVLVAALAYVMPMRDQVRFGQVGIILTVMCVADCMKPDGGRLPRGVLVGLAMAVKLTPGVFVIYLWITGRRRAAVTSVITAAGVTLGTFLLLPGDWTDYWFGALFSSDRLGANTGTTNQALRGMLMRTYLPGPVVSVLWIVCVVAVVVLAYRGARRLSLGGQESAGVAVVGLLSVAVSPVAWIHHLTWVIVAIGALAGRAYDRRRVIAAVVTYAFFVVPVPWLGVTMLADGIGPRFLGKIVQDGFGLGALALMALLVYWLPRRRDTPTRGAPPTPAPMTSRIQA
jgi:alpha-1,2-mannosyltransferase